MAHDYKYKRHCRESHFLDFTKCNGCFDYVIFFSMNNYNMSLKIIVDAML